MKIYVHPRCTTCKKALKFLDQKGVAYEVADIIETPPPRSLLKQALADKESIRALFNTSGMKYRELGLKDKLATMSDNEALDLLESDGMLVKRPFAVDESRILVGFKEKEWGYTALISRSGFWL